MISHSKPTLDRSDSEAINVVIESGMIAEGDLAARFSQAVCHYLNVKGAVPTPNGTTAIFLALKALSVKQNDEVILPSYVCRNVLDAVRWIGAAPVLCDIGEDWCINVETVKNKLSRRTKAIIVVHMFGISAQVKPICELSVPVVENICQAFGGKYLEQPLGTFGDVAICSFNATKLLTTGEGGMVVTNHDNLLSRLRELKYGGNNGNNQRHPLPLSDLQASLGLNQILRFDEFLASRKQIADTYFSELRNLPVRLPENIRERSIFFRFPIRTSMDFSSLQPEFERRNVQVRRGVDSLLHRELGHPSDAFPVSAMMYDQTFSLPIYPALKPEEVKHIIETCKEIIV